VDLTNCIPVFHKMVDTTMEIRRSPMMSMLRLFGDIDPTENLVGWYLVGGSPAPVTSEGVRAEQAFGRKDKPLVNAFSYELHQFFSGGLARCS
jgi:hypothetical protein